MPIELTPIALAALVPLLFMVLFLGVRILVLRRSQRRRPSKALPPIGVTAGSSEPAPFVIAPVPPPGASDGWPHGPIVAPAVVVAPPTSAASSPRKVDHQLARRYARPATAAWKSWCSSWLDSAPPAPVEPGWIEAIVVSFLALARPIVHEMEPSPDSLDPDAAASAMRAIYLHPERYVMIDGRWHVLEAVAPKSGAAGHASSRAWQMGPAGDDDPGGHTLTVPTPRAPHVQPFDEASGREVVQALTIEGLVETTGVRAQAAARTALGWAGVEDVGDDLVAAAVADAARIARALGVTA